MRGCRREGSWPLRQLEKPEPIQIAPAAASLLLRSQTPHSKKETKVFHGMFYLKDARAGEKSG